MNCQRETCQQIMNKKGDYIIVVKENQRSLLNDIHKHFAVIDHLNSSSFEYNDKAHGRIEQRACVITEDIAKPL